MNEQDATNNEQPTTEDAPLHPVEQMLAEDPEKLALMREKVRQFTQGGAKTISGSEAPVDARNAVGSEKQSDLTGADVDWSEYKLDYSVKHLYPKAIFRETPQGMKWVAQVEEFHSSSKSWRGYGQKVAGGAAGTTKEPLNLGAYLSDILNDPEGWTLMSMLPAGGDQVGILLGRKVLVVLPDPEPLEKETEVEPLTDPELTKIEEKGLTFMESLVVDGNPPTERDPVHAESHEEDIAAAAGVEAAAVLEERNVERMVVPETLGDLNA